MTQPIVHAHICSTCILYRRHGGGGGLRVLRNAQIGNPKDLTNSWPVLSMKEIVVLMKRRKNTTRYMTYCTIGTGRTETYL